MSDTKMGLSSPRPAATVSIVTHNIGAYEALHACFITTTTTTSTKLARPQCASTILEHE